MKVHRQKLKNGLRLITVPQRGTQAAVLSVFVGAGSGDESKEAAGVSHFLEHLIFKGTEKRPTPLAVAETIDSLGGVMNAFTGREYTGYFAKVNARHFDIALDWLSDIYLNAILKQPDVQREKKVILEELNMYLDLPMQYVDELWYQLLYGGHPLGQNIIGTRSSLKRMNRHQLIKHRKEYYRSKNTVVVLAGKVRPSSQLTKKINQAFARIGSGHKKNPPSLRENQDKPGLMIQFKKTDQTHFCLGVRGGSLRHPDRFAQTILATILGGNMSSRLFSLIREQNALAYYIRTYSENLKEAGFLVTQAGVDNRRVDQAIKIILDEYGRVKKELVPREELKKAKEHLKGVLWLSLERSESLADYYAHFEILGLKPVSPAEVCRRIDRVTAHDLKKLANDIFCNDNLNLALIGPCRAGQFRQVLKID